MVWSAEIILCFVTIWKYNIKEHLLDHHEQCEKYANEFCLSNKEREMVLKFKLVLNEFNLFSLNNPLPITLYNKKKH